MTTKTEKPIIEQVHAALRPRKSQTVGEIVKAMKFTRTRVDVALALIALHGEGRAEMETENVSGCTMISWWRAAPK